MEKHTRIGIFETVFIKNMEDCTRRYKFCFWQIHSFSVMDLIRGCAGPIITGISVMIVDCAFVVYAGVCPL